MEDQSRIYGQQDLSLPHDVVPLPSDGVFYKNGKKSVKVGYLTAADENIMLAGGDDVAYRLVRNKLYEPDFKVEDMLEGDFEAILIFLRNSSFGPEMTVNLTDPKTNNRFQANVVLDQLPIIRGQKPNEDGTFSVTLPKSGMNVRIKPLTYGEVMDLERTYKSYPANYVVPRVTLKLAKQIVDINGSTEKENIFKTVESLPIMDSKFIKKFLDDNEPRLDLIKVITAPSGENLRVNVGFGVDFFRPFF